MLYTHITLNADGRRTNRWIRSPVRLRYPLTSLQLHDVEQGLGSEPETEYEDSDSESGEDSDGEKSEEETSGACEANVAHDSDTDVPELLPLPDPYDEFGDVHRILRVCDGLRELDLVVSPMNPDGLFWSLLAQPSLASLNRLEIAHPDLLVDPHDIPTLPFRLETLILHHGFDIFGDTIPPQFFHAVFTSSRTTLTTLELRNQGRHQATFYDDISPSFHLVAATLTRLFLPLDEFDFMFLLPQCTSLTSLVFPVSDSGYYGGQLATTIAHLPEDTPATLTHLTVYDFARPGRISGTDYVDLLFGLQLPALVSLTHLALSNIGGDDALERWEVDHPALFKECSQRSLNVSEYFIQID
ncbi:hypothetical protein RQP46_008056 [Phenoliferia psychrophenolica]